MGKNENTQFRHFPNVTDNVYDTFSLIPQSNNMHCSRIHFQITSSKIYETLQDALNAMQSSINSIGTNSKGVIVIALISGPVLAHESLSHRRRETGISKDDVLVSEDRSSGNFTLDLDKSSCTPDQNVTSDGNITSVVYDFCGTHICFRRQ
ncbi:unnamed protein product [Rotaria sordida]|uniref:Uncharacterized protein n=1 Tax=Rotaria sordida TaxID=392033 RepID=A0A819SA67_9BILA|nr:unnamed protein product [Rotaria sordida]